MYIVHIICNMIDNVYIASAVAIACAPSAWAPGGGIYWVLILIQFEDKKRKNIKQTRNILNKPSS